MLPYLLYSSICLILFYLGYNLVYATGIFNRSKRFYIILSLLSSMVLIPLGKSFVPKAHIETLNEVIYVLPSLDFTMDSVSATVYNTIYWDVDIIQYMYVFILLGVCLYHCKSVFNTCRMANTHGHIDTHNNTSYINVPGLSHPFSFFDRIYIDKSKYTPDELSLILCHETTHVSEWHTWDNLLLLLTKIVFWFHPVVYKWSNEMRMLHEYAADQEVVRRYSIKPYITLLLANHKTKDSYHLMTHFFESPLKNRINMMLNNSYSTTKNPLVLWCALCILLWLGGCTFDKTPAIDNAISQVTHMSENQNNSDASDTTVQTFVDKMPLFPGCDDVIVDSLLYACAHQKMIEYIYNQLKYPIEAKDKAIEGTCIVEFIVTKEGTIGDINLLKDIGSGCGEEILRVFRGMKEEILWIPGSQDGKNVNVSLKLPIKFALQ